MSSASWRREEGIGGKRATAWLLLLGAGAFEVGFTTCLRYADGFRHVAWSLGFLACAWASFTLLDMSAKTIPLGTAYAVWVGIGAVGTLLVGVWTGEEALGAARILLVLGLVSCIVGLKLTSGH